MKEKTKKFLTWLKKTLNLLFDWFLILFWTVISVGGIIYIVGTIFKK
jgi:hypothetical protein